jgi:hypothetical protein
MAQKILTLIGSTVAICLILAACAGPPESTSGDDEDSGVQESTLLEAAVTPAPPYAFGNRMATGLYRGFSGVGGYTFDLGYTVLSSPSTVSVTNSAPGYSNISWTGSGSYTATNTADQRASNLSNLAGTELFAYWPVESALCAASVTNPQGYEIFGERKLASDGPQWCETTPDTFLSEGLMDVGQTRAGDLGWAFSFEVKEEFAAGIQAELDAGPSFWAVGSSITTTTGEDCKTSSVFWASDPNVGCSGPGAVVLTPSDVAVPVDTALSALRGVTAERAAASCAFAVTPLDLSTGLLTSSLQTLAWDGYEAIEGSDEFDATGFNCRDGANAMSALDLTAVEDTPSFLANEVYQEWETISEPLPMHGGEAWFTDATITPSSGGDPFPIVRYAWRSGDLLIRGKFAQADQAMTAAWLNLHLPEIVPSIAAS